MDFDFVQSSLDFLQLGLGIRSARFGIPSARLGIPSARLGIRSGRAGRADPGAAFRSRREQDDSRPDGELGPGDRPAWELKNCVTPKPLVSRRGRGSGRLGLW